MLIPVHPHSTLSQVGHFPSEESAMPPFLYHNKEIFKIMEQRILPTEAELIYDGKRRVQRGFHVS